MKVFIMLDQNIQELIKKFIDETAGVPFKDMGRDRTGLDCWGLVILAYREIMGIEIYDPDISAMNLKQVAVLFVEQSRLWREIPLGRERSGDVALFRTGRWISHAGVVVQPGMMIHTREDLPTCVEHYNFGVWKTRLAGIFRHADLV
jgi:probable lipoprotein NlpC